MNSKIFGIAAALALLASSASAADRMAPTWELPDGSKMAIVNDGKTAFLRGSSSSTIVFHCTPACTAIKTEVSFTDGLLVGVPKALAGGFGFWPAAKALRPDSTNLYNGSSSYSDARSRTVAYGGTAYTDLSSEYYNYNDYGFMVPEPPPIPEAPPPPSPDGEG